MNIEKKLEKLENIEKEIYEYFGFEPEWHIYPIENYTSVEWWIEEDYEVRWIEKGEEYAVEILPDGVYKEDKYTMIKGDTHVDRNQILMVFKNKNKRKE